MGHVNVPCACSMHLMLRCWGGGVGGVGHVNVPCTCSMHLMLRCWGGGGGVGWGMLTFLVLAACT